MIKWAQNFNVNILLETWEYLWKRSFKITICTRLNEDTIKMVYRWYMTPEKIASMGKKNTSNKCWKCQIENIGMKYVKKFKTSLKTKYLNRLNCFY